MLINCHSYYSLHYGTLSVKALVDSAVEKGHHHLCLSDINNSTAAIDFVKASFNAGIKPIAGIEFRQGNTLLYVAIARNNNGFRAINELLSEHNIRRKPLARRAPYIKDAIIIYPLESISLLKQLKANEFIGIRYYELSFLYKLPTYYRDKLIAWHPITHQGGESYMLHKHLVAIGNNLLLSRLNNDMIAHFSERMPSPDDLEKLFEEYPYLLRRTEELMSQCHISFDFAYNKNKQYFGASRKEDLRLLRQYAYRGMNLRYGRYNVVAKNRINKELRIIEQMNFSAYFLITYDIIQFSMQQGFYHVGRGSGANSVVAYCLQITNVDPIELDLYFERFINLKRSSPPDFDIDYSWLERTRVQKYIFDKYGRYHVALLGTINTFKGKSIYRELGKVYGLPKEEIDDLIKYPHSQRNQTTLKRQLHQLAVLMSEFPNLRSIHAGGIIISEEPLTCYTALDMPPKGFPTTQWDMYVAENIGFEKFDILSQRGIGHIKNSVQLIEENRNKRIDIHRVAEFKKDKKLHQLLESGETIGCFYIESPAMRSLLQKLRCHDYLTLVAASSIIRPGVARSGMMRTYIERHNNPKAIKYSHPVIKQQLSETYGVMIYQEDVLKIGHYFGGLDLAESDVLRRAISGKTRSKDELNRIITKFFANCKAKGYPPAISKEIWRQIESFAGYSFSKAHSASYAVESYQSLYLKTHFPLEFITAVINNFGGFYQSWVYFNEAQRLGATVMLPDVNHSKYLSSLKGTALYIGFVHIKNLDAELAKAIVEKRYERGNYSSLGDFVSRLSIGIEQLILLIRLGAFRSINSNKVVLMWEACSLNRVPKKSQEALLFSCQKRDYKLPHLESNIFVNAYDEIELLGFPVSLSYFELLKTKYRGDILAREMRFSVGRSLKMLGRFVCLKPIKTKNKKYMYFATFIDVEGNLFDTVHFPLSAGQYPFRGEGVYLLGGKVVEEYGFFSLEVNRMAKMDLVENPINQ